MLYFFIIFTVGCLAYALIRKKPMFLLAPVGAMFAYFIIQVILVPMPLDETIKFIFNLR